MANSSASKANSASAAFNGQINLDIRDSIPDWTPYVEPSAKKDAPNVLYVVWDDTGYGTWDVFGGLVEMPNMRRVFDKGVAYTQFHTVAFCSPTRSCLLTGRNATSNGMACIEEVTTGFPGSNGRIPPENATVAEVLGQSGWSTYAVGKWHLLAAEETGMGSNRRNWPLGRGFERYYGFLGGESDQFYPDLIHDNHQTEPPCTPEQGYHLSADLADKAIEFIRDSKVSAPDKPWLMYYCPGANHAPHQAPLEWTNKYKGKFDMGYEKYREIVLANQIRLGIIPEGTTLPPLNPYIDTTSADGKAWPEQDTVPAWDGLSDDEKKLFNRMAEVFAGFSSYTDHHIGRILDYLEESDQIDNTIIVWLSDNGASAEGGPGGTVNENNFFNGIIDSVEEGLKHYDDLGTVKTYNHYPNGWAMAFSTPFKLFKRYAGHEGGSADAMVMSWPNGIKARGELRHQYTHAVDVVPTIFDCLGVDLPEQVKGYKQRPLEGKSFRATFDDATAAPPKDTQFYMMLGTRGIWRDGWMCSTTHPPMQSGWGHFDQDVWELWNLDKDRNQTRNLAAEEPERLEEMKKLWFSEAAKYNGLPLDDRSAAEILDELKVHPTPTLFPPDANRQIFYPGTSEVPERVALQYFGRSFSIAAEVAISSKTPNGVLYAHGGRFGGNALFLENGRLHYVYNWLGKLEQDLSSPAAVSEGKHVLGMNFSVEGRDGESPNGTATLWIDGEQVAARQIKIQPGHFSLAGEGINAGRDSGQPVSSRYESPNPFTGGTLFKVILERGTQSYHDLERHLAAALSRD